MVWSIGEFRCYCVPDMLLEKPGKEWGDTYCPGFIMYFGLFVFPGSHVFTYPEYIPTHDTYPGRQGSQNYGSLAASAASFSRPVLSFTARAGAG
jgi:hypothetical protein